MMTPAEKHLMLRLAENLESVWNRYELGFQGDEDQMKALLPEYRRIQALVKRGKAAVQPKYDNA